MNKISDFCDCIVKYVIYSILGVSIISVPICIFTFVKKYSETFSFLEIIWVIPAVLILILIYYATLYFRKIKEQYMILLMITFGTIFSLITIFTFNTQPCGDYEAIWDAANDMANNNFINGLNPEHYMYYYNWQLGIAWFESLVIRLGGTFFTFKIISAILLIIIQFLTYYISNKQFGKNVSVYAYIISVLFLPWIMSVPQFTNHHIVTVILLISLVFLQKNKWYYNIAAGFLVSFMNLLRPLGILIVLSVICMTVYNIIKNNSKEKIKNIFLNITVFAAFFITYIVTCTGINHLFISAQYTDSNITDARIPYFKFQKGLYDYNSPNPDLGIYDYDYEAYNMDMKKELINTVKNKPVYIAKYVANKMCRYLGMFDYQFENTYNHNSNIWQQYPIKAFYSMGWFQYAGILLLAFIGYCSYLRKQSIDIYQVFFIGNTLVYLFIEAFSSYRFESYPFLIIFAALGYKRIERYLLRKKQIHNEKG